MLCFYVLIAVIQPVSTEANLGANATFSCAIDNTGNGLSWSLNEENIDEDLSSIVGCIINGTSASCLTFTATLKLQYASIQCHEFSRFPVTYYDSNIAVLTVIGKHLKVQICDIECMLILSI